MLHIDGIETNNGSVEADVCFGDVGAEIIGTSVFSKVSFGAVEGGEKGFDGLFISFLRPKDGKLVAESLAMRMGRGNDVRSKAGFVDSIVDVVIGPVIRTFNLCSQFLREKVNALIPVWDYVIEFCIEHADDFAGLKVDMLISSIPLVRRVEDAPHC